MTPVEVVRQAEGTQLRDKKGNISTLKLLPPLSAEEVRTLEARLPCPLPEEARDLFAYCRGFEGEFGHAVQEVDFSGISGGFGMEEIFPHTVSIVHDGAGNYWVVDLASESAAWGPIYYACHDAPVIVFQTDSLAHFIAELLRLGNSPWQSEITEVHDEYDGRIYSENPGVLSYADCFASGDTDLEAFARSLDETWEFIDLRRPRLGDGFTWGRYGAYTELRRFGEKRIFAYQKRERKPFLQRLFGKR